MFALSSCFHIFHITFLARVNLRVADPIVRKKSTQVLSLKRNLESNNDKRLHRGSNPGPLHYKCSALPLSYRAVDSDLVNSYLWNKLWIIVWKVNKYGLQSIITVLFSSVDRGASFSKVVLVFRRTKTHPTFVSHSTWSYFLAVVNRESYQWLTPSPIEPFSLLAYFC